MSYGGSSGSSRISTATDAALSNVANNDVLAYSATTQKWTNQPLSALSSSTGSTDVYGANSQTGSAYTLAISDAGKVIENTGSSGLTVTIPANATVAFPIGTTIELLNYSTGSITLAGGVTSGGNGPATTASDTFAGTDGSNWASQWTAQQISGSSGSATIQSNSGQLATGTTPYACIREYLSGMAAQADTDLSFTFTVGSQTTTYLWFSMSADNTIATNQTNLSQNCYAVSLVMDPTTTNGSYTVYSIVNNGTPTTLASGPVSLSAAFTYGFRFQRVGTTIQFRLWAASSSEPSSWQWSGVDGGTQPPAGRVALAYGNSNDTTSRTVAFDNLVVATPGTQSTGTVALRSVAGLRLTSQYAPAAIRKRATDEWIVTGATVV